MRAVRAMVRYRRFLLKKTVIRLVVILSILGMLAVPAVQASSDAIKLAILPFKVNADRDLTFLQKGIVDMLRSRLSRPGEVEILDSRAMLPALESLVGDIDVVTAKEIGRQLGVDRVLFGSITSIGEAVSIDTRVIDINTPDINNEAPAKPFYVQADTLGEVIPKIDRLTAEINHQIFGLEMKAKAPEPVPAPSPPATSYRTHPEKQFIGKKPTPVSPGTSPVSKKDTGSTEGVGTGSQTGPFIEPIQPQAGQFWRSQTFKEPLNGLAIGDVDGDGKNETILISDHQLLIYRFEQGRLVKVSETKKDRSRVYVGIDIADINANGRSEIFISALDLNKNKVRSLIMEFDGLTYTTVEKDSPWYYRVSTAPNKEMILLGQKPVKEDPYASAVYQLDWNGRHYEPGRLLVPKKKTNALGCAVGDLLNDGKMTVAAFSDSDAVQIFDDNGHLLNSVSDGYGGNLLAVNMPVESRGEPPPLRYLPMRMVINDLNGDGLNELVVAKNKEFAGKHLARLRMFTKTQIVGLNWDGAGMGEIWQTRQLTGRVADIAIADLEGDGRQDMVAVLVTKEGRLVGTKAKINLIAYPLESK